MILPRLRLAATLASLCLLGSAPARAGIGSADVPAEIRRGVEVVYAVVPRADLGEAVASPAAALAAEARFRAATAGAPSVTDLSIIVFVRNPTKATPLYGRLRVHIPDPIELEIASMAQRAYSIFVVDTGGVSYAAGNPRKHHEWVSLKVRL